MRVRHKVAGALAGVALLTGLASPAQAAPVSGDVSAKAILEFKNSKRSNTAFTAYFLPGCEGTSDKLYPGDWTELSFVSSVRVPAGTRLYYNGVLWDHRHHKSHCHTFTFFSFLGVVKMKRNYSW